MKRLLCTLLACALALGGLAGCGSIFDRRYSSVTTHQEQAATEEDSSILRAENYTDLVSCVQHFVSLGQSTGTVQVYKYSGDIASDLEAACNEVCTEDPLGAYALYGISYDYSRIISYYECTFTFSYRRSAEDIAAIVSAYGNGTIRDLIQEKLSAFSPSLAIRTSSFYSDSSNLYTLVQEAYYTAPGTALGYPEVSISVYPDSGDTRIVEFSFAYGDSQAVLAQRAEAAAAAAAGLVGQESAADNTVAWLLYSRLLGQTDYSPEGASDIYSALCLGTADSEGMALAYSLLCQQSGITCLLVQGTLNGQPHCWNLITMEDGVSWQVDVTRADPEGNFLHNDETMAAAGYNWSQEDYPACLGEAPTQETDVTAETEIATP